MIKGAKGESIEEPDDLDKEISLLEQKLNDISQHIEIVKNKESMLEVFDSSIIPCTLKFIKKAEKFEKFYLKNSFYILVSNGYLFPITRTTDIDRKIINENTSSIRS